MSVARFVIFGFITLIFAGCDSDTAKVSDLAKQSKDMDRPKIHPEIWPKQAPPLERVEAQEKRIAALISQMSLEEKVGQIIQADIGSVSPREVRKYHLGSILNGGNSAPGGNNRTTPAAWLALADKFWLASTDKRKGRTGIPALWGTDAVHGHNNIIGATLFPHNIGLGAANDPDLMYEIGKVTAKKVSSLTLPWIPSIRAPAYFSTIAGSSE